MNNQQEHIGNPKPHGSTLNASKKTLKEAGITYVWLYHQESINLWYFIGSNL
jgi:hypothetical protein